MRKLSLYSWRWAAAFAVAAMLAYIWLWYSPDLMAVKRWAATMSHHPVVVVTVMLTMAVTLLCLNFIGDGLRDALDPKER